MGVHGNERADILAKIAASTYGLAEAAILLSGCRTKLRELAAERWKEEWASNNSGAHLRALFPEPTKAIFAIHESLRRAASSVLVQIQTGRLVSPLTSLPCRSGGNRPWKITHYATHRVAHVTKAP
ncbi:hypothetical protein N7534_007916 [Penicillium rubens]|nr:hypothetical protein N7534_007916 [Penicillium rubens]